MKRLPMCLLGLAFCLAVALFATTAANALLTPLGNSADQTASLAIQTAPATNTVDDFGTLDQALLTPAQMKVAATSLAIKLTAYQKTHLAALPQEKAGTKIAWRSVTNDGSLSAALTAKNLAATPEGTTGMQDTAATARSALNVLTASTASDGQKNFAVQDSQADSTTAMIDSDQVTARAAPNDEAKALACYPNPFNGPTALVMTPNPAETTLTATSALATPTGGQPQCRAVNFVASLVVDDYFYGAVPA